MAGALGWDSPRLMAGALGWGTWERTTRANQVPCIPSRDVFALRIAYPRLRASTNFNKSVPVGVAVSVDAMCTYVCCTFAVVMVPGLGP